VPAFSPSAFGRYTLIAELGRGGMAEIFLARSVGAHGFERLFVIKRMHAHLSRDPQFTRMFVREARLSARLVHANVVPVFDFGEVDGHLYLALEYVDGVDLRPILKGLRKRNDPVPVEIACFVAMEVLRGLDYAHRQVDAEGREIGLVHRDVSPSNILVSREGEVKVCDFGIATVASDHMTAAGTLKGKFAYMSPEQARGLPVDRRADVFSVGLVLWEMLAARRLYVASDDVQTLLLAQHAEHPPPPVDHAPQSGRLGRIVTAALAASPTDRTPTAAAFADELQEYLAAVGLVGSSGRLAQFLRDRCRTELDDRERRLSGEPAESDSQVSGSVPSTFTSLPELPRDWAKGLPEMELDVGESEATGVVPPPRRTPPKTGEVPLWPASAAPASRPAEGALADPRAMEVPILAHLAARSLITPAQAALAAGHAARWSCRLTTALLANRFLTESDLARALAEFHGLPTVDLAGRDVSPHVFRKIPKRLAERLDVLAFGVESGAGRGMLSIAVADPDVLASQRDIEFAVGSPVRPYVARYSALTGAIRNLYGGEHAAVPPLLPPGEPEPADPDGQMVIERFEGDRVVDTGVDDPLELDDSAPRKRR
jgi:serine/threonine protein kinase